MLTRADSVWYCAGMTNQLTRRQRLVLDTAARLERQFGHSPSVRDIGRELGVTAATVQEHLVALERKGFVQRSGEAFGLHILDVPALKQPADKVANVPVVGEIAAGRPIEAIESVSESFPVPDSMLRGDTFFLRVRGDSMKDDHILDGDLVLISRRSTVENGEIAVALLPDGTATLKRVYRERSGFRLQPANEALKPIRVRELTVQGKVIGVFRQFT